MASRSLLSIAAAAALGMTLTLAAPVKQADARVSIFLGSGYYGPGYYGPGFYDPYYGYGYGYGYHHHYRHHCGWKRYRIKVWYHGHRHWRWVRRRVCW
jgi:hypothetical protein